MFNSFLNSLIRPGNESLIESIQKGHNVIFEGEQLSLFSKEQIKLSPEEIAIKTAKIILQEDPDDSIENIIEWMDDKYKKPIIIKAILKLKNIESKNVTTIDKSQYIIYNENIIDLTNDAAIYDLNKFITDSISSGNLEQIVPEKYAHILKLDEVFNKHFWESPPVVYHGTDEENIPDIKEEGLIASSNTRGMSNKNVGSAVFTSLEPETAEYHYGKIIKINTPEMKKDGFTPYVYREPDIEEKEVAEAIANLYGLDDYHHDVEQGMDEDTIIFDDTIPPKYLSIAE